METLKRLFPTMAEWPAEKWMGFPVAAMLIFGIAMGFTDYALGRVW